MKVFTVAVAVVATTHRASATDICDAVKHPKFFKKIPLPTRVSPAGGALSAVALQTVQDLGLRYCKSDGTFDPQAPVVPIFTTIWGVGQDKLGAPVTWPGFTIEARKNTPLKFNYRNGFGKRPHLFQKNIDNNLHMAMPGGSCDMPNFGSAGCVYTSYHLHGSDTPSAFDGYSESVIGPGGSYKYAYPNAQDAGTLWMHDHTLGITRLSVFAGLAQMYFIRDDNEKERMTAAGAACALKQVYRDGASSAVEDYIDGCEVELMIADRDFTSAGELQYQAPGPEEDLAQPEFFGPYMTVNGALWPLLTVQPTFYRLRLLNACDSRFLALQLVARCVGRADTVVPFYQVATGNGFANTVTRFPAAGAVQPGRKKLEDYLLMGPGSRSEVFVSFAEHYAAGAGAKCSFDLTNSAGYPFSYASPFGQELEDTPNPSSDGAVMRFRFPTAPWTGATHRLPPVIAPGSTYFRAKIGSYKEPGRDSIRKVILSENEDTGRLVTTLGAFVNGKPVAFIPWCSPEYQITEAPVVGTTEEWWIYNISPDTHPIHLHLVDFQVVARCPMVFKADDMPDYAATNAEPCDGPRHGENGPQDTVTAPEGYLTKVRATFNRVGLYVWHCHILSHEDNDMMRPLCVQSAPGTAGVDCGVYWEKCKMNNPLFPDRPAAPAMGM